MTVPLYLLVSTPMDVDILKAACEDRIRKVHAICSEHFNMQFRQPIIEYDLTGRIAGRASIMENKIKLNLQLLIENEEKFIIDTPGHEAAHLITRQAFGWYVRSHGPEWARVMGIINQPAIRCHNFEVKTNYLYICKCADRKTYLSRCRHSRSISGKFIYRCKFCKAQLIWQKLEPQTI